ncbi:MAG TPA: diguanylate cyclase [bacterium]|nr:diguanylate cyclase [bacterium]
MAEFERWFWVGSRPEVRDALAEVFGGAPATIGSGDLDALHEGDVVVVDPQAERSEQARLPHGHAYAGVRALKQRPGVAVYVLVDADDAIGVQLARFTLADGVLTWDAGERRLRTDELHTGGRTPRRPSVDDLLRRLQDDAGQSGEENSLQRLMRFEREDSLLTQLQDAETGLFDGPYATLKLDEEWKRAHRFHQPLSLLLLDLGLAADLPDAERRGVLAEAAGVFLNECRDIDVLARFSVSVFLFLLPGTGAEGARVLADRIVGALEDRLRGRLAGRPCAGLATVPSADATDRKRFVAIAEACLERARESGAGGVFSSWQ